MTARRFNAVFTGRGSHSGVSEGLNVLFADLIGNLVALGVPVAIYTTGRHLPSLKSMLRANGVDLKSVQIHTLIQGSRTLDRVWSGRPEVERVGLRTRVSRHLASLLRINWLAPRAAWLLNIYSVPLLGFLLLLVSGAIGLVVLSLLGVALLLLSIAYVTYRAARKCAEIGARAASKILRRPNGDPLVVTPGRVLVWLHRLRPPVYEQLYRLECARFAAALRSRREVDTCFFQNAFESHVLEALGEAKKKLVVFPDAVPAVFPTRYQGFDADTFSAIAASIRRADAIVCYSNYVRDRQLQKFFGPWVQDKRVEVIPQGFFIERKSSSSSSKKELNSLVKEVVSGLGTRGEVQFGSFEYVLYPSVDRPHKNTLTLVKAVEYLVRSKQVNIKLITTSHSASLDLSDYIQKRHLHREIIFMPGLPIETLNTLIEGALAVVHPSLAEGGDIFNFSRAVSHGCPALLSDIEVAREMFERHGIKSADYGNWLFNPFSPKRLAQMILDVQARRATYVAEQKEALRSLSTYSFEDMARRYYEFYCSL